MVAYARDEIISASDMARGFSRILNDLIKHSKDRFAISKNNKIEAVILPIDEYERMKEALDNIEQIEQISKNDPDYQILLKAREERKKYPENYGSLDDINW